MNPLDLLGHKIEELVHELSVLPFDDMHGTVTSALTLTNYTTWMILASATFIFVFMLAAKRATLKPKSRFVGMVEAGVEFVRNMAVDVIGPKDGPKHTPLLATFFFFILISNMYGLIPGGKPATGAIGVTVALALVSWLVFVWVGFAKNGFFGYFKSLVPSGVREMGLGGRLALGGFIFILEFASTFIVRPLTLAVRLFANMYAGHIILGVFSAFVALFWPIFEKELSWSIGGVGVGALSLIFLILMYAFEVFVAFIQAYVFTILTAVYIQSSVHASEH